MSGGGCCGSEFFDDFIDHVASTTLKTASKVLGENHMPPSSLFRNGRYISQTTKYTTLINDKDQLCSCSTAMVRPIGQSFTERRSDRIYSLAIINM